MASWALGTTEGTVSAELMGQESDSRVGEGRGVRGDPVRRIPSRMLAVGAAYLLPQRQD